MYVYMDAWLYSCLATSNTYIGRLGLSGYPYPPLCTAHRLEASARQIETDTAGAKQATELVISTMVSYEREREREREREFCIIVWLQNPATLDKYQRLRAENEAIETVSGCISCFVFTITYYTCSIVVWEPPSAFCCDLLHFHMTWCSVWAYNNYFTTL